MDSLKKQIEERKRKLAQEKEALASASSSAPNKYVKRGDLEKKAEPVPEPVVAKPDVKKDEEAKKEEPAPINKEPVLPREETIRRLRKRGQPITLFGESDWEREERLRQLEANAPDTEYIGQRNEFSEELEKLDEEARNQAERDVKKAAEDWVKIPVPAGQTEPTETEDLIAWRLQNWMKEWEAEMESRADVLRKTAQGKTTLAMVKQTVKWIKPLFSMLVARQVPADVVPMIKQIVDLIHDREYLAANDVYLRLAIGNAPWPMGVTMVGIHERSARESIFSNKVAHIMNDETQRKYIQSIKRLMTWLQKKYPNDPSKNMG